jgi:hypothetical protein
MKFRPTLLLCAVVLTVALPIWADTISYIGSAEESPNIAPSAKVTATSSQVLIAPANAEFPAEPASAVVLTDSFETNNALDAGDLNPSSILDDILDPLR